MLLIFQTYGVIYFLSQTADHNVKDSAKHILCQLDPERISGYQTELLELMHLVVFHNKKENKSILLT